MTVGDLRQTLNDPMLFDHTEVVIRVMDVTCDRQNPDDAEVETLATTVECTGKRVLVLHPADSLVLMFPSGRITHL